MNRVGDYFSMSLPLCPIQEVCLKYSSDSNRPPKQDVRNKIPCLKFLDMSCEMGVSLQTWLTGKAPSCDIEKIRKIKEKLND